MPHKKIAAFIARANAWGRFSTKGIRRTAAIGFSALSAIGMFATPLHAQDFIIGQTADHSAVQSASVKEMTDAAKAYFDKINNAGGIDGRKIKLISLDDKFDPKLSVSNAKKLIEENDVILMALGRGTSNAEALLPVLNEYRVPLVGHVGGSLAMHEPPTRYFFNLRPPYRVEVERAIGQLVAQGASKIGVV
jgi:branched-chain amino acid transport system substrate-binding protein